MRVEAITKILFTNLLSEETKLLARIHVNKRVIHSDDSSSDTDQMPQDIQMFEQSNFVPTTPIDNLLWSGLVDQNTHEVKVRMKPLNDYTETISNLHERHV